MHIIAWSVACLALFNVQYSYNVSKIPLDSLHVDFVNSSLVTCIYPQDRSFKKGSRTFPRSELRSVEEFDGQGAILFAVDYNRLPNGTDYSVWQIFGGGKPLLMIRHRLGVKQMVVFDGTPKIQTVSELPKSCTLDCKANKVTCGVYEAKGPFLCNKIHLKVGVYAQQVQPKTKMCIDYKEIKSILIS